MFYIQNEDFYFHFGERHQLETWYVKMDSQQKTDTKHIFFQRTFIAYSVR